MLRKHSLLAGIAAGSLWAVAASAADGGPVTADRLANAGSEAEAANWLMDNRTYDSNRYSPLTEITPANVSGMRMAFAVPLNGIGETNPSGAQMTPLIKDGFIYVADQWGTPYKINANTGKQGTLVWICDTGVDKAPGALTRVRNVGLVLQGSQVLTALGDGRVVACDDESGEVVWEQQITQNPGEGFEGTMINVNDKVVVGQSNGDWATRGFMAAIDPAAEGKELWRLYTIPEPGQPGSETWKCDQTGNPDCWKTGGAALWSTGSFEPATNTIYWGTGNPVPMMDPEYRPGDNLYSNSTLAVDADAGTLKWYFQYIPGDMTDYDAIGTHQLVDAGGRKLVALFNRDGFLYTLNREDGTFVGATPYIEKLTWTAGIDPKTGKPVEYDPSQDLQVYAFGAQRRGGPEVTPCPHQHGGVNFQPTAVDPTTGIAYAGTMDFGCYIQSAQVNNPEDVHPGQGFFGGAMQQFGDAPSGAIVAHDLATGKQVARFDYAYPNNGGVSLSPGLVWTGFNDATFGAYDMQTLKPLWQVNTGVGFRTAPSIYAVDGKEYVAILASTAPDHGHPDVKLKPAATILFVFSL